MSKPLLNVAARLLTKFYIFYFVIFYYESYFPTFQRASDHRNRPKKTVIILCHKLVLLTNRKKLHHFNIQIITNWAFLIRFRWRKQFCNRWTTLYRTHSQISLLKRKNFKKQAYAKSTALIVSEKVNGVLGTWYNWYNDSDIFADSVGKYHWNKKEIWNVKQRFEKWCKWCV